MFMNLSLRACVSVYECNGIWMSVCLGLLMDEGRICQEMKCVQVSRGRWRRRRLPAGGIQERWVCQLILKCTVQIFEQLRKKEKMLGCGSGWSKCVFTPTCGPMNPPSLSIIMMIVKGGARIQGPAKFESYALGGHSPSLPDSSPFRGPHTHMATGRVGSKFSSLNRPLGSKGLGEPVNAKDCLWLWVNLRAKTKVDGTPLSSRPNEAKIGSCVSSYGITVSRPLPEDEGN